MMRLMSRQKMTVCFERDETNQKKNGLGYDTIRDAILTCARKPT